MPRKILSLSLAVMLALPAFGASAATLGVGGDKKIDASNDVVLAGHKLRHKHKHRHCHHVVTLGHIKKICHKHRHRFLHHK